MCTVSYVPLSQGYILTSNRDEDPDRKTKLPSKIQLKNNKSIYCPVDALKGGTWIATDDQGRTACLLNGGFVKHKSKLTYRKSRGQFVLNAFEADNFNTYVSTVFLDDIEPFTLILVESNSLHELIWDGSNKHIRQLPIHQSFLWSSVTLYTKEEHDIKKAYFFEELSKNGKNNESILRIHGKDHNTSFILKHPKLQTVSITQVIHIQQKSNLKYILKDYGDKTLDSISLVCN